MESKRKFDEVFPADDHSAVSSLEKLDIIRIKVIGSIEEI